MQGCLQTVFSWHALTVLGNLRECESDFTRVLKWSGVNGESSSEAAIRVVEQEIAATKPWHHRLVDCRLRRLRYDATGLDLQGVRQFYVQ